MKYFYIIIAILFSIGLNAQVVDKTEEKAKKKANQRVDRKIDQQLDKGLDAIEGLFGKKKKKKKKQDEPSEKPNNSPSSNQMGSIMGMMGSEEIDRTYEFNHNFKLRMQTYKKDKLDTEMTMKMYINEETSSMGVKLEGEEAEQLDFMVYDMASQEMLTMMTNDGQKMGVKIETDPVQNMETEENSALDVRFEKTGESKSIAGFDCEEYQVIYEEGSDDYDNYEQYFWVTDQTEMDWIQAMSKMSSQSSSLPAHYTVPYDYPEGSVIEMVQYSSDKKEKSIVTVLEMNMDDPFSFSTTGYTFMNMPSSGAGSSPGRK